jgi:hypothetical protein
VTGHTKARSCARGNKAAGAGPFLDPVEMQDPFEDRGGPRGRRAPYADAQEDDIVAFLKTHTDRVIVPIPIH